ncbi:hypothetical protein TcCL_NonESM07624 [Trypanosoma cruzi]|nr:hypothetical protein TcCL_NonESM07624 [Trypanosoma cruzi]
MEGCPGGKGRRVHRVTGVCRRGEGSIPAVGPEIGPRAAALRTGAMRLLPALRQACMRSADHKGPSVSVAPSLPHCGDQPASASAGTSSRRENRNSFPTSERRIDVLLPNLRQSALFRPQYEGTCRTCSAWRYNSLRGPPMRMPQWRHRLPDRRLARRSLSKMPSMPADKARRKHKRGYSRWTRLFLHSAGTTTSRLIPQKAQGKPCRTSCGNSPVLENLALDYLGAPPSHDNAVRDKKKQPHLYAQFSDY